MPSRHARALELEVEIAEAARLSLRSYVATLRQAFVRIDADSRTGRTFEFVPQLRREEAQEG